MKIEWTSLVKLSTQIGHFCTKLTSRDLKMFQQKMKLSPVGQHQPSLLHDPTQPCAMLCNHTWCYATLCSLFWLVEAPHHSQSNLTLVTLHDPTQHYATPLNASWCYATLTDCLRLPITANPTLPDVTLHDPTQRYATPLNATLCYVTLADWLRLPTTANQTLPYATLFHLMQLYMTLSD